MSTLVTGVAGFIGMHTAKSLLSKGHHVVGIDNLNHYYDPRLKKARLTQLESFDEFSFLKPILRPNHLLKNSPRRTHR